MLILALDTALQRCSVAILRNGVVLSHGAEDMARGHGERLAPMVRETLAGAGVVIRNLDRIGVVIGPGGFTGVRVGLAFARGLAIGTGVCVAGVTSLAALAGNVTAAPGGLVAAVIDARRGEVYAGLYGPGGEVLIAPFVAGPEQALQILAKQAGPAAVTLTGSGAPLLGAAPPGWRSAGFDQIDAAVVARLAAAAPPPAASPAPLYLRAPDAKPPKPSPFQPAPFQPSTRA